MFRVGCGIGRVYTLILASIIFLLTFILLSERRQDLDLSLSGSVPRRQAKLVHNNLPKLNPSNIDQVENFLFFIGYPRSGHSIIASCLDAHPDIVIAHEFNLFPKLLRSDMHDQLLNRSILYNGLYQNSIRASKMGWRSMEQSKMKGYSLHFNSSNSWQGRLRKLRIIGDKSGGVTTRCIRDQPKSFAKVFIELLETVRVPIKVLHVIRNPYDMIATRLLYRFGSVKGKKASFSAQNPLKDSRNIVQALNGLRTEAQAVSDFNEKWGSVTMDVHNTNFIQDPKGTLRKICRFLNVDCSEGYLKQCSDVTFKKPHQSRHAISWSKSQQSSINKMIEKYPFFHGYSIDSL